MRERQIHSDCKVPPNPFIDHGNSVKHLLEIEREPLSMVYGEVNAQHGFIYADSFEVETQWDIFTKFEGSQKTIIGHSYHLKWVNKPFLVDGILKKVAEGKIKDALDFIYDWYNSRAEKYLELIGDDEDIEDEEEEDSPLELIAVNGLNEIDKVIGEVENDFDPKKIRESINELQDDLKTAKSGEIVVTVGFIIVLIALILAVVCIEKMRRQVK